MVTNTKYYKVREVAAFLSISDETVYRLIRAKKLRATRVSNLWRVSADSLEAFTKGESNQGDTDKQAD